MLFFLSLVTSVKDYIEIVHKLVESDVTNITTYTDFGTVLVYLLLSLKDFFTDVFDHVWSIPILIPDIDSAIISEVSVLENYFKNAFNLLETAPDSSLEIDLQTTSSSGIFWTSVQKFTLGFINSFFIWLPTSVSHLIVLRRFVIQGLEAGYIAGLGTIAGNILWILSILFGLRFFVIPWLSLDYLRYTIGFLLLIKYMWDSYKDRRMVLEDLSKWKIFSLSFLLALTEQTSIYPFISNMSIGPESTIIEAFPATSITDFVCIHGSYIFGLFSGCLTILYFMCWFFENPAFKLYMWIISSFKVSTSSYYKIINFTFLYLTMIGAICSIPYFGLDYTLTSPLGFVHEDRIFAAETRNTTNKPLLETSFFYTKASDRNTRTKKGRRPRNEFWKKPLAKYRGFDASLYDQGVFDLFTIEDLNYGFDRFWLRRKMRNRKSQFRLAPTRNILLNLKKTVIRPSVESAKGPRIDFFRMLSEQAYNSTFHEYNPQNKLHTARSTGEKNQSAPAARLLPLLRPDSSTRQDYSIIRKFSRKFSTRINKSPFALSSAPNIKFLQPSVIMTEPLNFVSPTEKLTKKDQSFLVLKTLALKKDKLATAASPPSVPRTQLLHPINFYLEKDKAFQRKLNFYGVNLYRKFSVENNAPFFRIMMKRLFYYYKPTVRWEKTLQGSKIKRPRRRAPRTPKKLLSPSRGLSSSKLRAATVEGTPVETIKSESMNSLTVQGDTSTFPYLATTPTYSYSVVGKKASRYRSEIYRDVLQHWYYSPFNRLLLKLDVDSFISRQPKAHFLTNKEEKLLHLRRFLVSEHYDTLRWYAYMQHYRTMKNQIGGTKSFASRIYNQQFAGTFKKIRHLFAVTPSLSDQSILKFDQPLFKRSLESGHAPLAYFHEELQKKENKTGYLAQESVPSMTSLIKQSLASPLGVSFEKSAALLTDDASFVQQKTAEDSSAMLGQKNSISDLEFYQKLKKHKFNKELLESYITRKREIPSQVKNKLIKERLLKFYKRQEPVWPETLIQSSNKLNGNLNSQNNPFQTFFRSVTKYFKKREKTEDFWKQKAGLNKNKKQTRKQVDYLAQTKFKKKRLRQDKKGLFTVTEATRTPKTKQSEPTRQKRDELQPDDIPMEEKFYIKKGHVFLKKRSYAKQLMSYNPSTTKKPKKLQKKHLQPAQNLPFLLTNSFKQSWVKRNWRTFDRTKTTKVGKQSYYYVQTKIRRLHTKRKRTQTKVQLENWWWRRRADWQADKYRTIQDKKKPLANSKIEGKEISSSLWPVQEPKTTPFYAGWDESLRKFVITDRLLSRQEMDDNSFLGGLNNQTTLYWRTPFSTYDLDQFFALGQKAYAPINWRRIEFRQTLLKTWKELKASKSVKNPFFEGEASPTFVSTFGARQTTTDNALYGVPIRADAKMFKQWTARKPKLGKIFFLQKHYERFRSPKRDPVTQTGPLVNQVLPTHYLYVVVKSNRENRDRYIAPRMRSYALKEKTLDVQLSSLQNREYTLRRRIKTRRKYHQTRQKNIVGQLLPRRRQFLGDKDSLERWRPFSKEQVPIRSRKKQTANTGVLTRIRQIKRRVFRGVIKPNMNLTPYAGGFLWPGDYLRLEKIKIPKFDRSALNRKSNKFIANKRKIKKRKNKDIGDYIQYQTQPKKYLIQRHNIKIIKNKLEKSQRIL